MLRAIVGDRSEIFGSLLGEQARGTVWGAQGMGLQQQAGSLLLGHVTLCSPGWSRLRDMLCSLTTVGRTLWSPEPISPTSFLCSVLGVPPQLDRVNVEPAALWGFWSNSGPGSVRQKLGGLIGFWGGSVRNISLPASWENQAFGEVV